MLPSLKRTFVACALGWFAAVCGSAWAGTPYKIVTASERGTYIQIGRDLAKFVAPGADIDLEVLPSAGSAENIQRLRTEAGVKLALVQSDVYQAFIAQGAAGNKEAANIIEPLRAIVPLYNEEIYFIARADSKLNYVHDIKDARLNVGPLRSGTAMSSTTLYRLMFGQSVADDHISFLSNGRLDRIKSNRSRIGTHGLFNDSDFDTFTPYIKLIDSGGAKCISSS